MHTSLKLSLSFILTGIIGCAGPKISTRSAMSTGAVPDGKLFAAFFQQRAGEYKALCFQAYNSAKDYLDHYTATSGKPLALITDIDETVLDNSPYAVHQSLLNKDYEPESWYAWTDQASADTVPGAPAFLKYAASRNVEIFYITNRDERERAVTKANLLKYQLPFRDDSHLILRNGISSKEARRNAIEKDHEVVMYIGDNLGDFNKDFDKKAETERTANVQNDNSLFGKRFIVLPNSTYGDWESSAFQFKSLTIAQKDSVIRALVKTSNQ